MTYGFLPFAILPLFVSIDRLDDALISAARDLYASGRAAFQHVVLPLTMPGIIAAALLTFIPAIGDYVTPDLLGGRQTTTVAKVVQTLFLSGRDWPQGAALGFILMAVTIIGTFAAIRSLRTEVLGEPRHEPLADRLRGVVYVFLFPPIVILIIFSFNADRRNFNWTGFTFDWYPTLFQNELILGALGVTLQVALVAVLASVALGTLLGLGLARIGQRWRGPMEVLLLLPMVTPEIVMGISLLLFFSQVFGRQGSFIQISLAHVTFCVSYVAVIVRARATGSTRSGRGRPGPRGVGGQHLPPRHAAAPRAGLAAGG